MNKNINSRLAFSMLLLTVIQVGGQSSYSSSIFKSPAQSMASFSAEWKQPVHARMTGNALYWKENSAWLQTANLEFYGNHFAPSGFTFNPSSLAGGRIFFYNPLPILTKELGYYSPSSKTQGSEFPNPYRVSGLATFNQNTGPKFNIWLPQKTEIPTSHQVVGALLYSALNVYSTWNQQMINNPIMNPNFIFIKP